MNRQTIRTTLAVVGAILLAAGALAYGSTDPWKTKPYEQWSKGDVTQILQDSPWAKTQSVGGTLKIQGNENLSGSGTALGEDNPARGGAGSGNGQGGGAAYSPIMPAEHDESVAVDPRAPKTYVVVWWSARTVREAAAQNAVLNGTESADVAKKQVAGAPSDIQIMVHGPNMSLFDQRSEQSFLDKAYIQLKSSKEKISPTRVEYTRTAEGHVSAAIFHFPMKSASGVATIPPSEKRIDFYCHVGEGTLIMNFEPAKMVDSQGVDL